MNGRKIEDICLNGVACYTRRDLILYALGIGCCNTTCDDERSKNDSEDDGELRYVYENHASFAPFPTFPLVLSFRAREELLSNTHNSNRNGSDFGMPPFPPHMMKNINIAEFIQKNLLLNGVIINKDKYKHEQEKPKITVETIIHLSEKLRLHHDIPTTMNETFVKVETNLISIQPKKIGIIVITETKYYIQSNNERSANLGSSILMATSESTTLYILKNTRSATDTTKSIPLKPLYNRTYQSSLKSPIILSKAKQKIMNYIKSHKPNCINSQIIPRNQALIYRLSGDTNSIHVVTAPSPGNNNSKTTMIPSFDQPILHGLCTLGYSIRVIMEYCHTLSKEETNHNHPEFQFVSCQFVKPVFIGDELEVLIWIYDNDNDNIIKERGMVSKQLFLLFQVRRRNDQAIVVNNGFVEVKYPTPFNCKEELNSKL